MEYRYSLNINDMVSVSLTPYGKEVYFLYLKKYYGGVYIQLIAEFEHKNNDNILTTELWSLMQTFGEYMYMGNKQLFVNNKISFKKDW